MIRTANRLMVILLVGLVSCLAATTQTIAQPAFPALTGRVVDEARLLSAPKEAEITAKLEALEAATGDQLVVVTVNSLHDYEIEDYGYQLGRAWGIGAAETDSGVLLIVAPNERKVRIEVGYGLEPVLTDALSNQIIQTDILPPFREGGYERGITAGVDAIDTQLRLDPAEAQARAAAAEPTESEIPVMPAIIIAVIFILLFINMMRSAGGGRRRRGRKGGIDPILVWGAAEILSSVGRGGSSGGSSFGGFSGGGGSFGGGGASGGW
ncbi:MAG: methanol dehydrogenase [Brevundimonas sp. 12-68-7]|uniref:Methanol dehydrogenase n=2 Tax=Brevundimonas TaxID=41275 RepID=A0A258FGL2_9CAUL|nr:MAG: methanol dehydrogenase [Brevundimonas sp. 12-68-7]OYX30943.1 MAG: methanol dehydrogenase [Brevundimonas subvibrioides]